MIDRRYRPYFGFPAASPETGDIDVQEPISGPVEDEAVFVSIDIENFCFNRGGEPKKLTEVGISSIHTRDVLGHIPGDRGLGLRCHIKDKHFVIKENLRRGHGKPGVCGSNWHKGDMMSTMFCSSELVSMYSISHVVRNYINTLLTTTSHVPFKKPKCQLFVIFHGPSQDVKGLNENGIHLDQFFPEHKMIDTQNMGLGEILQKLGMRNDKQIRLEQALSHMGISHQQLHNGSNDARYTLELLLAMTLADDGQESISNRRALDRLPQSPTTPQATIVTRRLIQLQDRALLRAR